MATSNHQEVSEAYHIMQGFLRCGPLRKVIAAVLKLRSEISLVDSYSADDGRKWLRKLDLNGNSKRLWKSLRRTNRNTSSGLQTRMNSRQGIHHLVLDEQIGIICKYCSHVSQEIRHILPTFSKPSPQTRRRGYFGQSGCPIYSGDMLF